MTEVFDDPDHYQQKLKGQLDKLKKLIEGFEQFPKKMSALAQEGNDDSSSREASEVLQQLWESGLRDNVKKMTSYTQQIIGLQEVFKDFFEVNQLASTETASDLHGEGTQSDLVAGRPMNEACFEAQPDMDTSQAVDRASLLSMPATKKKVKRFV